MLSNIIVATYLMTNVYVTGAITNLVYRPRYITNSGMTINGITNIQIGTVSYTSKCYSHIVSATNSGMTVNGMAITNYISRTNFHESIQISATNITNSAKFTIPLFSNTNNITTNRLSQQKNNFVK